MGLKIGFQNTDKLLFPLFWRQRERMWRCGHRHFYTGGGQRRRGEGTTGVRSQIAGDQPSSSILYESGPTGAVLRKSHVHLGVQREAFP
jgi:hypothetical protein